MVSPQKSFCIHPFFTFQLYLCQNQCSILAGNMNSFFICKNNCSGCLTGAFFICPAFPYLKSLSIYKGISTWPWVQSTYQSFQFHSRLMKVHKPHLFVDHCRIRSRALLRLLFPYCSSLFNRRQRFDQKFCTGLGKLCKKTSSGFLLFQRDHNL